MRKLAQALLSDTLLGMIDYYRFTDRRESWGGAFNGQLGRQNIFLQIVENTHPIEIIETGTFQGTTTEFLTENSSANISTIESHRRIYGFSKMRFLFNPRVKTYFGDSRLLLKRILNKAIDKEKIQFVYLDAHWNEDLPLKEELDIVFQLIPNCVVMIDDFKVPDDEGYGYDDYGVGKALTIDYLDSAINQYSLSVYFPVLPAIKETGARRGCCLLGLTDAVNQKLSQCDLIRPVDVSTNAS